MGFNSQIPEPEIDKQQRIISVSQTISSQAISSDEWQVQHFVKNGQLYIECYIPHVTFAKVRKNLEWAKLAVYINGKKKTDYHRAAFILKDIPKGQHTVTLKVVGQDNQSLGIKEKSFTVLIP